MPRFSSRFRAALALPLAVFLWSQSASAEVILADDFTGSGSVPSGWTDIGFDSNLASTILTSGGVVTINDTRGNGGPQFMQSSAAVATDTLSLEVGVASMSGSGPRSMALLGGLAGKGVMVRFDATTKNFALVVTQNGGTLGTFSLPGGTHLPTYSSGAFSYLLQADLDSVRLSSAQDSFDSGDLLFSSLGLPSVTSLTDLGSSLGLLLGTEASSGADGALASIEYERVELIGTAVAAAPEPSQALLAFGGLAMLALRRRRGW